MLSNQIKFKAAFAFNQLKAILLQLMYSWKCQERNLKTVLCLQLRNDKNVNAKVKV